MIVKVGTMRSNIYLNVDVDEETLTGHVIEVAYIASPGITTTVQFEAARVAAEFGNNISTVRKDA